MNQNQKTMTLRLTRGDVIGLLLVLACVCKDETAGPGKWLRLHQKIKTQVDAFDEKEEARNG